MKRLATIVGILGVVGIAGATETRVWTFAQGNVSFLTDDELIIRIFPSQMFQFDNFVTVENPIVPDTLKGGFFKYASLIYSGDNFGAGMYVGQRRVLYGLNNPVEVFPVSFVLGVNSESNSIALNFTLGHSSSGDTSGTVVGFRPSLTVDFGNSGVDLAAFFDFEGVSDNNNSSSTMGFGFDGRYYGPVVVPVQIHFTRYSNSTKVNMGAGIGNTISIADGNVLGIAFIQFNNMVGREFSLGSILGGEFNLWRGIIVRGSIRYDLINYESVEGLYSKFHFGRPGPFTFGAGYDLGFARVDLALSTDLLTKGPFFLTGNSGSAIITMLSLYGKF